MTEPSNRSTAGFNARICFTIKVTTSTIYLVTSCSSSNFTIYRKIMTSSIYLLAILKFPISKYIHPHLIYFFKLSNFIVYFL